jgi:hypothetical protein
MSKWSKSSAELKRRIARALIVGEYTDERAIDYLGRTSRADTRSAEGS